MTMGSNQAITEITKCRRCGSCCRQGGPALHKKDLPLVRDGRIQRNRLITIRQGELVLHPYVDKVRPATVELVKLSGGKGIWSCCYYDETSGCTIYSDRPIACSVLKCWDTAELLDLVEKETLNRFDIIDPDEPILPMIIDHERLFPCDFLSDLASGKAISQRMKQDIQRLVTEDLKYRSQMVTAYQLHLEDELFYFGRPLFQNLKPLGIAYNQSPSGIRILW